MLLRPVIMSIVTLVVATAAIAGIFAVTKPRPQCCIPKRNYQFRNRSRSEIVISNKWIPAGNIEQATQEAIDNGVTKLTVRHLFQLPEARMAIDHCAISNVAVMLGSEGTWYVSMRGDQRAGQEGFESVGYLKRTQFAVNIRGYGNFDVRTNSVDGAPGKPVLFQLPTQKFWVQRGQPYTLKRLGHDPAIGEFFDSIDRVEVEFFYYKAANDFTTNN